jgi:hypothetical protein
MPDESAPSELIKHISAEITAQAGFLHILRARMAFTVLIGPFFLLGSFVIASAKVAVAWPHEAWGWTSLVSGFLLLVACYFGLGEYGSRLDRYGTNQCDFWRKEMLAVVNDKPLTEINLVFPQKHRPAYLWGFVLVFGAFLGLTLVCLPILAPSGPASSDVNCVSSENGHHPI